MDIRVWKERISAVSTNDGLADLSRTPSSDFLAHKYVSGLFVIFVYTVLKEVLSG